MLQHLPHTVFEVIVGHLGAADCRSLSGTCTALNSVSQLYSKCHVMRFTWPAAGAGNGASAVQLTWPTHAAAPSAVVCRSPEPETDLQPVLSCFELCWQHPRQLLRGTSCLQLEGWKLPADFLSSLPRLMPSLHTLSLDKCEGFSALRGQAVRLQSLTLHCNDWATGTLGALDLPTVRATMSALTHFAYTCAREQDDRLDITPLAHLGQLRELDLALPALTLAGLPQVAAACLQLTSLRFCMQPVNVAEEVLGALAITQPIKWPKLQVANLCMPDHLLRKVGVLDERAPCMERLYVYLILTSARALHLAAAALAPRMASGMVQAPLTLHCYSHPQYSSALRGRLPATRDLPTCLSALEPLIPHITHLVLVGMMGYQRIDELKQVAADFTALTHLTVAGGLLPELIDLPQAMPALKQFTWAQACTACTFSSPLALVPALTTAADVDGMGRQQLLKTEPEPQQVAGHVRALVQLLTRSSHAIDTPGGLHVRLGCWCCQGCMKGTWPDSMHGQKHSITPHLSVEVLGDISGACAVYGGPDADREGLWSLTQLAQLDQAARLA